MVDKVVYKIRTIIALMTYIPLFLTKVHLSNIRQIFLQLSLKTENRLIHSKTNVDWGSLSSKLLLESSSIWSILRICGIFWMILACFRKNSNSSRISWAFGPWLQKEKKMITTKLVGLCKHRRYHIYRSTYLWGSQYKWNSNSTSQALNWRSFE